MIRTVCRALLLYPLGLASLTLAACGAPGHVVRDAGDLITPAARSVAGAGFDALASERILRVAMTYTAAREAAPEAPVTLTASDGTGLELQRYDARAVVDGPLAFTEVHLTFRNPEQRVIEGRFAITLPPAASISRLAMKNDAGWQEAEVVERQLARRAYEDFLHRRQDPALLEKEAGNEFSARIFPIPAGGTKEIIVSYSEEITEAEAPYRLRLGGLPAIAAGRVEVLGGRGGPVVRQWSGSRPEGDVTVPIDASRNALASEDLVAVRVAPSLSTAPEPIDGVTLLFDTSASRAPGFQGEVERLARLVASLRRAHGDEMRLRVATFDQVVTTIFDSRVADFGPREVERVLARRPLGASDLGSAIAWLATGTPTSRAVLVTDGIPTLGATEASALRPRVAALRGKVRRLDAIAVGGIRDATLLAEIVRGHLERDGVVADGALGAEAIAAKLSRTTASGITVAVAGATWSWPERLDGVQPGDTALVFAKLAAPRSPGAPVQVTLGSGKTRQEVSFRPSPAIHPLLERAAVRAEIDRLGHARSALAEVDVAGRDRLAKTIVDRSVKYRVLSDFTALLVLESESDYDRYGIDRRALTGILTVDPGGRVVARSRTDTALVVAAPEPRSEPQPESTSDPRKAPVGPADGRRPPRPPGQARTKPVPIQGLEPRDAEKKGASFEQDQREEAKPVVQAAPERADDAPAASATARSARVGAAGPTPPRRVIARETPPSAPPPPPPAPVTGAPADRDGDGILAREDRPPSEAPPEEPKGPPPYAGRLADVMAMLAAGRTEDALFEAIRWQNESPGDVMALVALGEALEASGHRELAARTYGSIIDLFPSRADLRRYAGMRIERLGPAFADLAADTFGKAAEQRPDHLTGHRSYAFALVRAGKLEQAFEALRSALRREYPSGRFAEGERILREDLGLVAAAWAKREPARRRAILERLEKEGGSLPTAPSLRFILQWETDANDVDFHIRDGKGGHAFYSQKELPSGGALYADVTSGYGPECFTIEGEPQAYPYRLQIHYYSRGPMGFGMGRLEVVRHDGQGNLGFEQRPFVVMNDGAYVELGTVDAKTAPIERQ